MITFSLSPRRIFIATFYLNVILIYYRSSHALRLNYNVSVDRDNTIPNLPMQGGNKYKQYEKSPGTY